MSEDEIVNIAIRSSQRGRDSPTSKQNQADVAKKAKERKEYMLKLEMEKSEKDNAGSSNKHKITKTNIGNESEDIVKLLNTCKQRTAAFSIRDQQLKDKKKREQEERDYERLMDLEMEVNRLKDIAQREKEEEAKIKKRIADRKVIEDQIKERQHHRLLQEEARDQENRNMLEKIRKYGEEDKINTMKRKEEARKAKIEMIKRNEGILAERESRKAFEKKEEEMIVAYLAERDAKALKREEEEAEAQRKKIELQKKLLESQTKILDKRSEIDELRARRAAEENERKHRQRELEETLKRKKKMDILHQSRKQQEQEKMQKRIQQKKEKQVEYNDVIGHATEMAKRERQEAELAKMKNAEFIEMLQKQIEDKESKKKIQVRKKYEEGRAIKDKMVSNPVVMKSSVLHLINSCMLTISIFSQHRMPKGTNLKIFDL